MQLIKKDKKELNSFLKKKDQMTIGDLRRLHLDVFNSYSDLTKEKIILKLSYYFFLKDLITDGINPTAKVIQNYTYYVLGQGNPTKLSKDLDKLD